MNQKHKKYSEEFKLSVLREYYSSGMSKRALVKKYGLFSRNLLTLWIRKYDFVEKSVSLPANQLEESMANRSKDDYKEENAQLKKRIRELNKALEFSRLETMARDMMIDKVEEYFDIPIRKKIWGQVATELVSSRGMKVASVCRLFGHCRQAFYQSKADIVKEVEHERKILAAVREIREEDPS